VKKIITSSHVKLVAILAVGAVLAAFLGSGCWV
jgi:hypothetical protein